MNQQYTQQEYEEQVLRRVEEAAEKLKQQKEDGYRAWKQSNED